VSSDFLVPETPGLPDGSPFPAGELTLLAVGGWDPSLGAGLARDLLTARALGAQVWAVGTAWTIQGGSGRMAVEPRAPHALAEAVTDVLGCAPGAVKLGLVPDAPTASALATALASYAGPVVFDPVLAASAGGALFVGELQALSPLLRRATVITPNLAELACLTGSGPLREEAEAVRAARQLCAEGIPRVVVKGGHLADEASSPDFLVSADEVIRFDGPRWPGPSPRGTGCAFATALAVALGRGLAVPAAVASAKRWLASQIAAAGPVHGAWHLP